MKEAPACVERSVSEMSGKGEDEDEEGTHRVGDGRLLGGGLVRERALGRLDRQVVDLELRRKNESDGLVQNESTREGRQAHLARDELADELANGDESGVRVGRLVDAVDDEAALEVLADRGAVGETCASHVCGARRSSSARRTASRRVRKTERQ